MKKILVLILCAFLVCAFAVVASAEDGSVSSEELNGVGTENLPTEDANAPESENTGSESIVTLYSDMLIEWAKDNVDKIALVVVAIATAVIERITVTKAKKAIGISNNNAVAVSENSTLAIGNALTAVTDAASVVNGYKEEMAKLLAEVRANAEEKMKLEQALSDASAFLKTAKLANVELANEVAELLVLANIPNSKKEELYSRHLAAVGAIAEAEKIEVNTEVKEDVEQTA